MSRFKTRRLMWQSKKNSTCVYLCNYLTLISAYIDLIKKNGSYNALIDRESWVIYPNRSSIIVAISEVDSIPSPIVGSFPNRQTMHRSKDTSKEHHRPDKVPVENILLDWEGEEWRR